MTKTDRCRLRLLLRTQLAGEDYVLTRQRINALFRKDSLAFNIVLRQERARERSQSANRAQ